ncbi:hypothetical protein [Colwellia psychrerythraea]|uniref:ATP-grasp domain-containing protein n=1 Tax=Colwellia psychrerythraea (strain 34H / ATCC BAA-681) TaxID=167879 RepID=Q47ZR4_COLP3|nr:hypothetical protein [Colwellia psychrerythraea]AAZ28118.1 hypothetical protein CPS_3006 [Colwellia psychrerythraea 34H]
MIIRILLILSYVVSCIRLCVKPWYYFRLNAPYFNESKGLFSKLDIDRLIPNQWRVEQWVDDGTREPTEFPVFVKPEWGQNSRGISRADNLMQIQQLRLQRKASNMRYLVQEAARGAIEFEIFTIANHQDLAKHAVLSVTQVNNTSSDKFPINGIYNKTTQYHDITPKLSREQLEKISQHASAIGKFKISRLGVRANSIAALVAGDFEVIEINLFVPMPLVLLCQQRRTIDNIRFVFNAMYALANVTKQIHKNQPHKAIFFRKLGLMRQHTIKENEVGNESH